MPALPAPEDTQAIQALLVDYCLYLDTMDLAALADLFTADCVVVYGSAPHLQAWGREALAVSLQRMWRWRRTSHHLSNVRIRLRGPDRADATSYVLAWHERPDGSTATVYGQYRDDLLRTGDGWRIARRQMLMNGADAGFKVPLAPLRRRPPPEDWQAPDIDH